jgi:hypothetical protein
VSAIQGGSDPAFPSAFIGDANIHAHDGMTLRDYFAAKAMASLVTKQETAQAWKQDGDYGTYVAELSYGMADAMIAARNKQ